MYSAIADQANFLKLSVRTRMHADTTNRLADANPRARTLQPEKETYQSTRKHAADYMRTHPDDFLPFLPSEEHPDNMMGPGKFLHALLRRDGILIPILHAPDEFRRYCDTVEKTAEWGGEPEVRRFGSFRSAPLLDLHGALLQIRALSLYYQAPVIVVQAGTDMVEHGSDFPRERAMLIS